MFGDRLGWDSPERASERGIYFSRGAPSDAQGVREVGPGDWVFVQFWGHPGAFHMARAYLARGRVVLGVPAVVELLESGLVAGRSVGAEPDGGHYAVWDVAREHHAAVRESMGWWEACEAEMRSLVNGGASPEQIDAVVGDPRSVFGRYRAAVDRELEVALLVVESGS